LLVDDSTEYQEYTPTRITSDGLISSFKRLSWYITQTHD
jgi:hypothetical protein